MTEKFGWRRDLPDIRDFEVQVVGPVTNEAVNRLGVRFASVTSLPSEVNLQNWCSAIEDQQDIGSCTAHAAVGLYEFYERLAYGKSHNYSRLFVYKNTRMLMNETGDCGAYLRDTMKALAVFGACEEKYHEYDTLDFDRTPTGFAYSFAQNFKALTYFRLDRQQDRSKILQTLKTSLFKKIPFMFGFTVYDSYIQAEGTGGIPFPLASESAQGGHAVMAVGYDDGIKIVHGLNGSITKGAFLIRNSWGTSWGDRGYGWLPYDYVLRGLAKDFWSMTKAAWLDLDVFNN